MKGDGLFQFLMLSHARRLGRKEMKELSNNLLKEVEKEVTEHFGERVLQMVKAGFAAR